ncbi:MAG: hypothetical protein H6732_14795 [Alphaproteobacteria bacterium]|nr:hypothetical protein [Alphaproteobacteria bacterium]
MDAGARARARAGLGALALVGACAREVAAAPPDAPPPHPPDSWLDWPGTEVRGVSPACVPPRTRLMLATGEVCGAVDLASDDAEQSATCGGHLALRGEPGVADGGFSVSVVPRPHGTAETREAPATWLVLADGTSCFARKASAPAGTPAYACRDGTSLCGDPSLEDGVLRLARCDAHGRPGPVRVPVCLAAPLPPRPGPRERVR